jgi:hypothetical protein
MDKDKIKFTSPFTQDSDDFEWLELGKIPEKIPNPFLYPAGVTVPNPVDEFLGLFTDANYLHAACYYLLGVELPPYQLVILDTLWRKKMPMLIGTRGMAKSFILAVYISIKDGILIPVVVS